MMSNSRRWLLSAVVCFGTFGVVSAGLVADVHAQEKENPETIKKVLGLIKEANAMYDGGRFDAAYKKYQEAYGLYPDAAIAYRLGQTADKLKRYREAKTYYEAFLVAKPNDPIVNTVKASLERIKAKIPPRVKVVTTPATADVYVNDVSGEPVATTPKTIELKPGKVTLYVRLDGYETAQAELDLKPAQDSTVTLTLVKKKTTITPPEVSDASTFGWTKWGGVTAGVGGAFLLAGGVFSVLQSGKTDDVNSFDKRQSNKTASTQRSELQALKDSANTYHSTSVVMYTTGAVISAAGVGMLIYGLTKGGETKPPETAQGADVQWHAGWSQHGGWFGLSGQF